MLPYATDFEVEMFDPCLSDVHNAIRCVISIIPEIYENQIYSPSQPGCVAINPQGIQAALMLRKVLQMNLGKWFQVDARNGMGFYKQFV